MKKYILTAALAVMGLLGALHAAQPTAKAASCCDGGACCDGSGCCVSK